MMMYESAYYANEHFKRMCRKKRPSEDAAIYNDLISHTTTMPISSYVVNTLNDCVFEQPINRELHFANEMGGMVSDIQDWAELFMLDADLTNTSLDGVMENIGDLTSIYGYCWVFVDMPTAQTGYETSLRPYVVPVSPTNVWDWEFTEVRGVMIPEYVKVLEREEPDCYYFKCYYLGTKTTPSYWETYEVEKGSENNADGELQPIATGQFPLGMSIPGFMAYTKRDPRRFDLGISDIAVAADVQKEVYKLECEAFQSIQFARTLIRAEPGVKVPAQAGSIVRATMGQIEAIPVDQQDVLVLIEKQQDLLTQFQTLTGFGGINKQSKQVQSGVSIVEERKQLHRMAKAKARLLEVCEEQIWTFASRFMNVRWAGEVSYGTDYDRTDSQYRIALLEKAKQMLPENPIINGLVLKEFVGMLVAPHELPEYQEAILATQDETIKLLDREQIGEIYSRDVGDQVPEDGEEDEDSKSDMEDNAEESSSSTNILQTGQSMYPQQSAQSMLFGPMAGR
jgi:hypothetical protein